MRDRRRRSPMCGWSTRPPAPGPWPQGGRERGYTLVVLAVSTAVLGILLTASLPMWSTAIKREKEAELLFRGMQYAEAIRVYQNRFGGGLPTSPEQLLERKPRSIRQLWTDPMTEDGEWELIAATPTRGARQPPGGRRRAGQGQPLALEPERDDRGRPARRQGEQVGPFHGVRSRSEETSLAIFNEQETYDAWEFVLDLIPAPQTRPETGVITRARSDWVGRGFPEGMETQLQQGEGPRDGAGPDSQPSDGRGNQPRRGRSRR